MDIELNIFEGDIVEKEFPLLYAVGKGSKNRPVLINMVYRGNRDSKDIHAFIGNLNIYLLKITNIKF